MYCAMCGVKLSDSESHCPLCKTKVFHPEIPRQKGLPNYPPDEYPIQKASPKLIYIIMTVLFSMPIIITLLYDWRFNGTVTWSGYVIGALLLAYVIAILPAWFQRYHAVIFVPCSFFALGLYLLYISLATEGGWFLRFAFPVVGFMGLLVSAIVTLLRYIRRGRLYVYGGGFMAFGLFMPLMEFLMNWTFDLRFVFWSVYPTVIFTLFGGLLIFLAISKSARRAMERKFFI